MPGRGKLNKGQKKYIARNLEKLSLQEIAGRLGIDVESVKAAIREIDGRSPKAKKPARPQRPPHHTRRPGVTALCVAAIAIVALAAYANSIKGLLFFDNREIILQNPLVQKRRQPAPDAREDGTDRVGRIFSTDYWSVHKPSNLYRPLTVLSYYLNYSVSDEAPPAGRLMYMETEDAKVSVESFHIVNMLIHALNGVLLYCLVLKLTSVGSPGGAANAPGRSAARPVSNRLIALMSALLFVAHPITTEAVTNVVGRADLLVMMFCLAALLLHIRALERKSSARILTNLLAAVCFALALLSKENAISFLALAVVCDLVFARRAVGEKEKLPFGRRLLVRLKNSYAFYAVVAAGWFAARYFVLRGEGMHVGTPVDNPIQMLGFLQREMTAVMILGFYLWRLVWPVTLSADYSYNQIAAVESFGDVRFLGALAAVIFVLALAAFLWRRDRAATFFILFFFIAIAPVSNIIVPIGTIAAERLLYLPSVAWSVCLAMFLFRAFHKMPARARMVVPVVLLSVVTALYGARTLIRNLDWQDPMTFWRATYATSPNSVRANTSYAMWLFRDYERQYAKDNNLEKYMSGVKECSEMLENALDEITEEFMGAHINLGLTYVKAGDAAKDFEEKERFYLRAEETMRRAVEVEKRICKRERKMYLEAGMKEDELPLGWSEKVHFTLAQARIRRSEMYARSGRTEQAGQLRRKALLPARIAVLARLNSAKANEQLARLFIELGRTLPSESAERREMLELAAVTLSRLTIFIPPNSPEYRRAENNLQQCFGTLGIAGVPGVREDYKRRALKSAIMMQLLRHNRDSARDFAEKARRLSIPQEELNALFNRTYTLEDYKTWLSGEVKGHR